MNHSFRRRASRLASLGLLFVEVIFVLPAARSSAAGPAQNAGPQLPVTGQLTGISCLSQSSCWAVGLTDPGQSTGGLEMERWNGTDWASVPSLITDKNVSAGQGPTGLSSFTCSGKNSCWAAGSTASRDVILHWNGRTWSVEWSRGYESLSGVTCAAKTDVCWAVGTRLAHTGAYKGAGAAWFSVILHRTGQGWSSVPSVDPSRAAAEGGCTLPGGHNCYSNRLVSVACAGPRLCWAAGDFTIQGQQGQCCPQDTGELLRWDGARWSAARASIPKGVLTAVACSSEIRCWAVGSSAAGHVPAHLVAMLWNGKSWSRFPSTTVPPLVSWSEGRTAMSCPSTADCWVVGVRYPGWCGTTLSPIAVHWNGRTWSDMAGTLPTGALLTAIAPLTSSNAWAVGWDTDGSQAIFHWTGSRWSALTHQAAVTSGGHGCSS